MQVAIARKILVVVWNILVKDTQYINFNDNEKRKGRCVWGGRLAGGGLVPTPRGP